MTLIIIMITVTSYQTDLAGSYNKSDFDLYRHYIFLRMVLFDEKMAVTQYTSVLWCNGNLALRTQNLSIRVQISEELFFFALDDNYHKCR